MKTDKKIISILLEGAYARRSVEAIWSDGLIAVHIGKGRSCACYAITHIATGKRITSLWLREQALEFAKTLAAEIDWNFEETIPSSLAEDYRAVKSLDRFSLFEFVL